MTGKPKNGTISLDSSIGFSLSLLVAVFTFSLSIFCQLRQMCFKLLGCLSDELKFWGEKKNRVKRFADFAHLQSIIVIRLFIFQCAPDWCVMNTEGEKWLQVKASFPLHYLSVGDLEGKQACWDVTGKETGEQEHQLQMGEENLCSPGPDSKRGQLYACLTENCQHCFSLHHAFEKIAVSI